ncbi:MAG: beta-lactamase family protein, partial [Deltaproteobacteria bacterium]|nr:beta-lactamase family protein [Deltaproteobacteria bacterium]
QRDTLVNVFSVGKALVTTALLILVDRGEVELDAAVSHYWPQFALKGKGTITVRTLLSHRAGLPAVRQPLPETAMYDWSLMTAALADEEPWWRPGQQHGYHVNTFGFLVGEIVRRVSGQSVGKFVHREIADPLDADFHFGLQPDDDQRVAEYIPGELFNGSPRDTTESDAQRRFLLHRVYLNPQGLSGLGTVNTREWRAAEMPSTNGHANAHDVARVFSALAGDGAVDGVQLLKAGTIAAASAEASSGEDYVLRRPSRFGLGFQLTQPERPLGPNARSFGHFGAGGSLGFADPDARLAFGYTMNHAGPRWQNPRIRNLIDAVYAGSPSRL